MKHNVMKNNIRPLLAIALVAAATVSCGRTDSRPAGVAAVSWPCQVALAPGPQQREIDRTIADLQERARQPTHPREALEQLGYQFVARARLLNDAGDYKLTEHVAQCLEEQSPGDPRALLLRGHALHQLHRFHEAETIARKLVGQREFVLDYGLLGDALMEQGRLTEAAAAYQKMIDLKPFYQSYTRAAHLRWLTGDIDGAIDLIHKAIDAASSRNRESVAWAYTRLALYELQRGRLTAATHATDAALSFQPDYPAAFLARGRVLLALDRSADAVETLSHAARLNPLPEYQWALADALRRRGLDQQAKVVERDLVTRGGESDPRTLALFLATRGVDPQQALALTERELLVRQDVFTEDARAWALAAAGRTEEARASIGRALAANTRDARLFLHAGAIAASAGRRAEACRWLARAEAFDTTLLPSELDILRRYRSLRIQTNTGE
jgi:tetratricopeptide (TPR) repeat protein